MGFAREKSPVGRGPEDTNPEWQRIYAALARAIGEKEAQAWFSHCRFVQLVGKSLELAHWNGFTAAECLKRHGRDLAAAAHVTSIRVHRSGGYHPVCIEGAAKRRKGYEQWGAGDRTFKTSVMVDA